MCYISNNGNIKCVKFHGESPIKNNENFFQDISGKIFILYLFILLFQD